VVRLGVVDSGQQALEKLLMLVTRALIGLDD
jgi:hypothetical protein